MEREPYRMTFGKHKNQTLDELPPSYRSWLIEQKIYADKAELKAALVEGNYLASATAPEVPQSTPTRKRRASIESEIDVTPPFRAKKVAISREAKSNDTMLNYDGSAYILDFGKHAGSKLSDVPSTYISWLIEKGAHEHRPDFAAALHEQGLLGENDNSTPDVLGNPTWRVPSVYDTTDKRFYDSLTQSPLWISDNDVSRYFGLSEPILSQFGAYLVSEAELKRNTEFPELFTVSKGPKRWLYQVFTCAGRNGGTLKGGRTANEALVDFLGKNRRREGEIWDSMGLGQ